MKRALVLAAVASVTGAFATLPATLCAAQDYSTTAHSNPAPKKPEVEPGKGKPRAVTVRDHRAPKTTTTRDHRKQPEVRDHRKQPEARDHRAQPTVRDQRTAKQGGVSVETSPRNRGSKDTDSEPRTPNEIVQDFLGGLGLGRPRRQN